MITALTVFGLLALGIALTQTLDAIGEGRGLQASLAPLRIVRDSLRTPYEAPALGHPALRALAPPCMLAIVASGAALLPLWSAYAGGDANVGLFFYAMLIDLAFVGIATIGWAANAPPGVAALFGAVAQFLSYAIVIGFGMIGPAMEAQSLSPSAIAQHQVLWYVVTQPGSFILYFAGSLAQSFRHPFSEPLGAGAGGALDDLGGAPLLCARWALDLLAFAVAFMGVVLFFGGWNGVPGVGGSAIMFAKTLVWLAAVVVIRGRLRTVQYERLIAVFWKVGMPVALVNVIVVGAVVLWLR